MSVEIKIKPKTVICRGHWTSKIEGVVLVQNGEDIEPLYRLLCEQDDYWKYKKHLIKVAPKEIDSERDLISLCDYCGKTDIYDVEEIKKQIPFIIFQYHVNEY